MDLEIKTKVVRGNNQEHEVINQVRIKEVYQKRKHKNGRVTIQWAC